MAAEESIGLGATGIRESSVRIREKIEAEQKEPVLKLVKGALDRLKNVTSTEADDPNYISFPISKYLEEYGISNEDKAVKTQLAYYLRGNKNIVTKLGEADNRVVPDNMKPFAYSYVSEEKKQNMGLDAYCMKNLTSSMKEYIQQRAEKTKAESDIYDMLLVCDYLTAHDAHKEWIKLMGLKLSADIGQPILRTKKALDDLVAANILITGQVKRSTRGKATICRLAYSIEEYSDLNNQLLSGKAAEEFKRNHCTSVVVDPEMVIRSMEPAEQETAESSILAKNIEMNLDGKGLGLLSHDGLTNGSVFGIVDDKKQLEIGTSKLSAEDVKCLQYIISCMKGFRNGSKEGVRLEETVAKLQKMLSFYQKENLDLRDKLAKAESEANRIAQRLKAQEKVNQAYSTEARKSMNQLISSVSTITERFTQIAPKRVTPDDVAEFKNGIITAATEAQNRLRDFVYAP